MMRCVQCGRDYPEAQAFCHQCGEALLPTGAPADRPPARERIVDPSSQLRARAISRRRAPRRAQSLLFASIVVLGAFAGLALVWRQAWMPSLPRITLSFSREAERQPAAASNPTPQVAAAPAAPAPPPATSEPERPSVTPPPTPAPSTATPTPAPAAAAPVTPRASEPVAAAPPPAPKRTPEPPPAKAATVAESAPAPSKAASRPEPAPAPTVERPAPPKLLSARTDPAASLPTSGTRVIALVPVGPAAGARGQLLWEPMGGGTLVVSGLPQPPAGRTYQLWLGSINLGNRVSAGLLAVDAQGTGTLRVAPPRATWSPDIFGVTMERQGGAREPSDDLVLVGELSKTAAASGPSGGRGSASIPISARNIPG